ncbi:Protein OSCP1 [Nymphon striatum]|nr:Protein OSCP1 [Nymphon striatum]
MSVHSLPLLFINLGGEMVYILDQRLRAQTVPSDKSGKVLTDIIGTMFNKKFIEELFKPQDIYNKRSLYTLFEKVAHASIMHLNSASMDKLYDLMMMAFKYQILMCQSPSDLLPITLNHLDAIRKFVSQPNVVHQVEFVYNLLIKKYKGYSVAEFQFIRHSLFNFFQGLHIRVSIFLQRNVQKPNGHFIVPVNGPLPCGTNVPGTIKIYEASGKLSRQETFEPGCRCTIEKRRSSISVVGDRVTTLGTNMYADESTSKNLFCPVEQQSKSNSISSAASSTSPETKTARCSAQQVAAILDSDDEETLGFDEDYPSDELKTDSDDNDNDSESDSDNVNPVDLLPPAKDSSTDGKDELKLLAQLLGNAQPSSQPSMMFTLNLNSPLGEEENSAEPSPVIQIDATKRQSCSVLSSIMEDLTIEGDVPQDTDPDLLDLMDS